MGAIRRQNVVGAGVRTKKRAVTEVTAPEKTIVKRRSSLIAG
jgi:hypothetical protein